MVAQLVAHWQERPQVGEPEVLDSKTIVPLYRKSLYHEPPFASALVAAMSDKISKRVRQCMMEVLIHCFFWRDWSAVRATGLAPNGPATIWNTLKDALAQLHFKFSEKDADHIERFFTGKVQGDAEQRSHFLILLHLVNHC